jgi:cyclic pyranopterin phosphate synthase
MVDVPAKLDTAREATAKGSVYVKPETFSLIVSGGAAKRDVLTTAQFAGVRTALHDLSSGCFVSSLSNAVVSGSGSAFSSSSSRCSDSHSVL